MVAMNEYTNASDASRKIGCSIATVSRWAERLGINRKYGTALMLTNREVEMIRELWKKKAGNPQFGEKSSEKN
jgi:hypothetical protein